MEYLTYFLLVGAITILIIIVVQKTLDRLDFGNIQRKNGCQNPRRYPHKDKLFGLDLFFAMGKAMKAGKLLETTRRLFDEYGRTFETNSWGTTTINTSEPRNIQIVLSLSFKNFGKVKVKPATQGGSLMAEGIFTADGSVWARSRALIRPTFARSEISNFRTLEKHVSRFLELIPRDDSTIDLQPLIKRLFLDISTEFLFGESVDSQLPTAPFDSNEFLRAFDTAMQGLAARMMLGKLKFVRGFDKEYKSAVKRVHVYLDKHVSRVLQETETIVPANQEDNHYSQKQYILLNEMIKETRDPMDLRYQLLHVFIPAHDATGIAVSDMFFHLARDRARWEKLRTEVLSQTALRPLSFEILKSMKYLRYVFNKIYGHSPADPIFASLRLHPTAGIIRRICHHDTILPLGGGSNGQFPVLVRKGTNVVLNFHVLHRDKEIWGEDADDFCPKRWETARPTWEYLPFSGGPRICPAQQMVYTDAAYITVRVVQLFAQVISHDSRPWSERFRMTVENRNGVQVKMVPA